MVALADKYLPKGQKRTITGLLDALEGHPVPLVHEGTPICLQWPRTRTRRRRGKWSDISPVHELIKSLIPVQGQWSNVSNDLVEALKPWCEGLDVSFGSYVYPFGPRNRVLIKQGAQPTEHRAMWTLCITDIADLGSGNGVQYDKGLYQGWVWVWVCGGRGLSARASVCWWDPGGGHRGMRVRELHTTALEDEHICLLSTTLPTVPT